MNATPRLESKASTRRIRAGYEIHFSCSRGNWIITFTEALVSIRFAKRPYAPAELMSLRLPISSHSGAFESNGATLMVQPTLNLFASLRSMALIALGLRTPLTRYALEGLV